MKSLALVAIVACLICSISCQINLILNNECREITIKGRVNENADNFAVEIYPIDVYTTVKELGKIPFHLNARFGSKWGEQVPYITLNSNDGTKWNEEVSKSTSLKPGSEFKLRIHLIENNFNVYLNDEYFNCLTWRNNLFKTSEMFQHYLRILGDVTVSSVSRTTYINPSADNINTLGFSIGNVYSSNEKRTEKSIEIRMRGRIDEKAEIVSYYISGYGSPFRATFNFNTDNVLILNNYKTDDNGRNWGLGIEQREKLPVARGQVFSHKIVANSTGFILSGDNFSYTFRRPVEFRCIESFIANMSPSHAFLLSKVTVTTRY